MPEKYIEVFCTYHLTDGRALTELIFAMCDDPARHRDSTDFHATEFEEVMAKWEEEGKRTVIVNAPSGVASVIPIRHIVSVSFSMKTRDLRGEEEISTALHNRQIKELREMADQVESEADSSD